MTIEQQQAAIQLLLDQQQQILRAATAPDAPQVGIINADLVALSDQLNQAYAPTTGYAFPYETVG